ncbi:hypothetical protein ASPTUDRAFT_48537 [Aspergillus tubingensis CBS 134.48]|uniref:Zn(2)-C6 fungal-type domain-containing protein n=1 Tax=Aspergillus tubingensis (strain CBS 134.48) TaxID=767770 RepID=A0A1L9MS14_ASPTC|nr:hypothetical protein ASPTUDRAFT_48537 [Aspergillus tubingensis CBS 134.48]
MHRPGRPTRFKDSCDNCAQAKVKCSRDRPNCFRCVRSGLICRYSLARRGKAAMASKHANHPLPSAPKSLQHSVRSLAEDFHSHLPDFTFLDEGFALPADFASRQANPPNSPALSAARHSITNLAEDFGRHAPDYTSVDDEISLSANSLTPCGSAARQMAGMSQELCLSPHESNLDFSLLPGVGHGGSHKRDVLVHTIPAMNSALTALPPDSSQSSEPDDTTFGTDGTGKIRESDPLANIQVVLSTLKSLHMPPTMPTLGIDMILKVTSMAIDNLLKLLKDPSGLNSSNITLLTLVCCNGILEAYQLLLFTQRKQTSANDERDRSEGTTGCCYNTTAVYTDIRISVGEFLPDRSVKQKIILSVLLSELGRVGNVIERTTPSDSSSSTSVSQSRRDGGEFVSTLKPVLQEKLKEIDRVVRAGITDSEDIHISK